MNAPAHQAAASIAPQEGEVLAGKYRIERILGKGGMGVVVAATHLQLGQRVAIKLLLQPGMNEIVVRFLREARAAVRLRGEHIARVLDVGELVNGAPYMVMEYLDGQDLLHHLRAAGPLPIPEAVDYILQTCEAIAEAHSIGIIHRDLKPANLFLAKTPDGAGSIKVLDFGISKATELEGQGDGMQLTQTLAVLGSPLYMSPEQLKSAKEVDPRSDIWALGIILYQLLAGRVPFKTSVFSELILMVNMDAPPPLSIHRPDVPAALEAAVMRCLEKPRASRFQNVAELAWAIADFGFPAARFSAEKTARVLETAGISVQMPPGVVRTTSIPMPPAPSTGTAQAVTAAPVATAATGTVSPPAQQASALVLGPAAATAQEAMIPARNSSAPGALTAPVASTVVMADRPSAYSHSPTTAGTSATRRRGPIAIALVTAGLVLAGTAGMVLRNRPAPPVDALPVVKEQNNPAPPASVEAPLTPPPEIVPSMVIPPQPVASATASIAAPVPPPATPTQPAPGGGALPASLPRPGAAAKSPAPSPSSAPPPAASSQNPFQKMKPKW